MLGAAKRIGSTGARALGAGARRFSGYQGGMSFSTMGKARMGAGAAGVGMLGMHSNANRGSYKSGYIPKSTGTRGLTPKSSGGMMM